MRFSKAVLATTRVITAAICFTAVISRSAIEAVCRPVRRLRFWTATLVAVLLGLSGGVGWVTPGSVSLAGGSSPVWAVQATYPSPTTIASVSCASTSDCVAVGSAIWTTTDGGATWDFQTFPAALDDDGVSLESVSCSSTSNCMAVGEIGSASGGVIITTTDGGADWTAQTPPSIAFGSTPVEYQLEGVSCTSATQCVASGDTPVTSDNPYAQGFLMVTDDGGANWSYQFLVESGTYIGAVSCSSNSDCVAVANVRLNGMEAFITNDGGQSWTSNGPAENPGADPRGVSCPSSSECFVAAGDLWGIQDGGATWTDLLSGSALTAVSCSTTSNCVAVGGSTIWTTTDGGSSWTSQAVPSPTEVLTGISCPSTITCVAVGINTQGGGLIVGSSPVSTPTPTPTPTPPVTAPSTATHGYWLVGSDGGIFSFGSAQFYGSTGSLVLQRPVVGIVPTKDDGGYWLDASDGGVFSFGDTQFYGSIPGLGLHPAWSGLPNSLNAPIVGMVPSNDDHGYFMVASDGGVFAFGDAHFAGSCPGIGGCSGAAVAVMPDASGNGYWVITQTGNVYSFGDAPYFGAPGHGTVTSAVATPDGKGYWVLLSDGEVFGYGDAGNLGYPSSDNFYGPDAATAIFATSDGAGYWVSSALGAVFNYGDAPNDGGMSGTHLNGAIIAATGF